MSRYFCILIGCYKYMFLLIIVNVFCLICDKCILIVICVRMCHATLLYSELQTSSLVCDCRLEWFIRWMLTRQKGSRLRVSELAVCGIPTALKGTLLKELTVEDLHCGECCT